MTEITQMTLNDILSIPGVIERHYQLAEYQHNTKIHFLTQALNEEPNIYKKRKIQAEIDSQMKFHAKSFLYKKN